MSLAKLFYMKETFRASVRRWRQACFRKRTQARREQRFTLEALEPRLLLDASPLLVNMEALGHELTVQVQNDGATSTVVILDTATAVVVASQNLADTSEINFVGSDANDALTIDQTAMSGLSITFAGGTGIDTLLGPAGNTTWDITGDGAGHVGAVAFSGVENLTGAADNEDTFVFEAAGSITGLLEGGAGGFDSIDMSSSVYGTGSHTITGVTSGVIVRDGDALTYSGFEPGDVGTAVNYTVDLSAVTVAQTITLSDDATAADGKILITTTSGVSTAVKVTGTLTIIGGTNVDTININALDSAFGANLIVQAGAGDDVITVNAKTGAGSWTLDGEGGTGDSVNVTRNANVTLTDTSLSVGVESYTLAGIEIANLTGGAGANTFTVSGWSGAGSIAGAGGSDTVVATKDKNFTLTNGSLAATDGMSLTLSSIQVANLTGGASGNSFAITGWTGTGTLDGDGGTDTVTLSKDADFTLTSGSLSATGGPSMTLSSIEVANLTGGASANAFTIGPWSGTANVNGQGGDDNYVLKNNFGTVAITEAVSGGTDTLDFTAVTTELQISADKTTITTTGGSVTQSDPELAEEIDVTLLPSVKAKIVSLFRDISDMLDKAQGGADKVSTIVNALPFLGELTGGKVPNLADLLSLTQTFKDLEAAVQSALASGSITTLSGVVNALNGITKPGLFTGGGNYLTFSTDYQKKAGSPTDRLEALIDIDMRGSAAQTVDLETGPAAKGLGIDIDSTVNVSAVLSGTLSVGFDTFSATADDVFLVPGGTLTLDLTANASISSAPLNLGILALTISSGSVNVHSHVDLTLTDDPGDTDARITASNIASGPLSDTVSVTMGDTITPSASLTVSVNPGVKVGGSDDLSSHAITTTVTFSDGVFGSSSGPSVPEFSFSVSGLPSVSMTDFGHVSLNDLLGMLGQVLNSFSGIGENAVLKTAIPFTGETLGDVVDLASGFKKTVLDPLFKSGDILNPDFNGDSVVNLNDLAFSSIQGLAKALTAELGLGSLLDVDYDASTKELTFAMNYHQAVGDAGVVETKQGNETTNEVQTLTVNAVASGGVLADTFKLAFPKSDGTLEFTSAIALGAAGSVVQTALEGLSSIDAGDISVGAMTHDSKGDHYVITFLGAVHPTTLNHKNVPLLTVNADELARGIPLNFGASLGDIANVQTDGDIILSAGFDTGFIFGIDLNQNTKIEITPPLFKPDNTAQVLVETTTDGTSNLDEVQKIHVNNATGGTYTLWFDANKDEVKQVTEVTDPIEFDALATGADSVESALELLGAIVNVDVSQLVSGNDRTYTVTFRNPGNNVAQLVADPTNLKGVDKNGILSANASFDAKLLYNPAATVVTKQQGDATLLRDEQQLLMIASATGGTFTLGFSEAVVTGPLVYGASGATVQTALEGLTGIGVGNVAVTKIDDNRYTIDFTGALAEKNVAQLIANPAGLTNSAVAMTLSGITVAVDVTNKSLDDLRADVEAAVNQKLIDTGNSLGFFTANLTPGSTFTAAHTPMSTPLATDLAFSVAVKPAQVQITTTTQGDGTHNEVQTVTVTKAVGGTFTLTFGANTTSNIAYDATAATVQSALEGLASIGVGNVAVTQSSGAYIVTFQNGKGNANQAQLTANSSALISTLVTIATTQQGDGSHNEVQTVAVPKNATGGTFTLTFGANTTGPLAYNASAATVQSALEGLASIGIGNVAVTLLEGVYTVTFQGAKANTNVAQLTANSTELMSAKVNGSVKKLAVTDAASLPVAIQAAINNALNQAGITTVTVAAGLGTGPDLGKITLTPTGGKLTIQFRPALTVDAGGGRIAVEASPVTIAVDASTQSVNVDGRVQVTAAFDNTAYQEMGLLSAPTSYSGTTSNQIDLTLIANGNKSLHIVLPTSDTSGNLSLADLVGDLQTKVNTALGSAGLSSGDVEVFLVDPLGNRIGFRGKEGGPVTSLSMNVPDSATNGAITDLGYVAGNGETHSSKADHFFLEDVHFNGNFDLAASGVEAKAGLGFLGITATGGGSLGSGKFIHAEADILLKNPTTTGDPDRVTVSQIADSLKKGHFFFDSGAKGVDSDGNPTTGVVDATLDGGVGFHLDVEPTTPIGGISGLDASLDLTLTSPNWFTGRPSLADPLGFGTDEHALSTSPITLDTAVPGNGRLTDSVTFVLTDGTHFGTGFLPFSETSAFTSPSQLTAALQAKVNAAIVDFEADGGAAGKTVTVGLSGGKITLTASDATLSVRGPVAFSGPDLDAVLDKFRNLDFSDIIAGLKFVVDYLRSLDGSGGAGGAVAGALDAKLPLLDRSIADLVDVAGAFADKLNTIVNNPSSSIQELNQYIDGLLGLPLSTNVLSFDAGDEVLNIDYDIIKSVHLTRPFNLDLADAGLPAVFTNLVSLSASGNLDLSANVEFNLALGLDLSGPEKSFFIKTGSDPSATGLHADLTATGNNLSFDAQIGPFGLFVIGGSAGLNGHIDVTMVDDGDGRFDLVTLTGISPTVHLPSLSDVDVDFSTTGGKNAASVNLPLFIGTKDNPVPLDFAGSDPGNNNALTVDIDLVALLSGTGDPFDFTLPEFDFTNLSTNLPGIFALLSDPSVTVDGLDRLLGTIQDAVSGQIMGTKLPLIGDALANNPASQFIGNMRSDVLQPLAKTIRENNLSLEGLIGVIQTTLFDVFGPSHLNILKDSSDPGSDITKNDIKFTFFEADGVTPTTILFLAHSVQLEMDLGKTFSVATPPIDLDLGIDALGIHAQLQPEITLAFDLKLGFGVDDKKGFYFVTDQNGSASGMGASELSVTMYGDLGSTDSTTSFDDANRAKLDARLLFLALKVADGVDLDGNGTITRGADANGNGIPDDISEDEFSHIYFSAGVDLADPNDDGRLTIGEMVSGSFSDIVKPSLVGEAELHAQAKVDFSTLGPDLGNVLPSISTDLLVDFSLSATPSTGFQIAAPQVILANVTLDLGSFVSSFAGPILNQIHDILEPFDWLIGPDGFLNKRIPLLSDLAGHKITGKDLILLFDPKDGPTVVAVLDFVQQLEYLSGLVSDAASGGNGVGLNFGDLVLFDSPDIANPGGAFLDHLIDIGGGVSDLRTLNNFKNVLGNLPDPATLASKMQTQGSPSSATSSFTSGVTQPGSIDFAILKPENIFKLILGQPDVTLVTVNLPKMGFNFLYRQQFPIIGPLVGTFAGGVGGGIDMGFGYDTRGLSEFLTTHNAADLVDGFFLTDLDLTGADKPEAFLTAQIAVGAAISLGFASAGVEGGISAEIDFNFADLDNDGKIRILELGALLEANDFNPLAVFDVSGDIELFMRAYVEFLFFKAEFEFARLTLFEFEVSPIKPPVMGSLNGDVLTLNVGPSAASRLNGNVTDANENIVLTMDGSDVVVSSFTVNGVDQHPVDIKGFGRFSGVHSIIIDGGSGNDTLDLSGIASSIAITMHGGVGDDVLKGGAGADTIFGDAGLDEVHGGGGIDTISGGDDNDTIYGDGGNDILMGDAGDDYVYGDTGSGGVGNDTLSGGSGNDHLFGEGGTNVYLAADFGSIETIDASGGSDTLDFSTKPQGLTFFLENDGSLKIKVGMTQTTTPTVGTDPLDPSGLQVPSDPTLLDFESRLTVINVDGISKIKGSDFADTFYVRETKAAGQIELDGGKGSDRYIFFTGVPHIDANVHDTGNPWDSGDTIEVRGTTGGDTITVTNADITLSGTQSVDYVAPAADANVLQIKVFGKAGDDTLNLDSTALTVPVRIDGGTGHDLFTVGKNTLDNILGLARTGLNSPFGLGPVVLVGGAGQDSVVVTDEADLGTNTGNLTVFTETRLGVSGTVEVGIVSGLGMKMTVPNGGGAIVVDGRVEFEGFETVDVRLGKGDDSFTVGGDAIRGSLPQNRQSSVGEFLNTLTGMTIVEGGGGSDTIGVIATNTLDRSTLLTTSPGPLVLFGNPIPGSGDGITGTDEVQTITVKGAGRGVGFFTIQYRYEETRPIRFGATASEVLDALVALPLIGTTASNDPNVSVVKSVVSGNDVYTVTFQNDRGKQDIPQLTPVIAPLTITGDTAAIGTKVQTTQPGAAGTVTLATIQQGGGGSNEQQTVAVDAIAGTFKLTFGGQTTAPLLSTATGAQVQAALNALSSINTGGGSVSVGQTGTTYTITFDGGPLANTDVAQLTATPALIGNGEIQKVTVRGVNGLTQFRIGVPTSGALHMSDPIDFGATDATVKAKLEAIPEIGVGNVDVAKATVDGADVYTISFKGMLASKDVAQLIAKIEQDGNDIVNVQSIREDSFFLGGGGTDTVHLNVNALTGVPITSNGVNAKISLDGQGGSDNYDINLVGETTASLVNVFDTGVANDGSDTLTVTGTELPDRFLMRAAAAQKGLAFIALLNHDVAKAPADQPVERVNYDVNLETIVVNSLGGDDEFYIDDTRAKITVNSGDGDDFFQIAQLYQTERIFNADPVTNIAEADAFATIETTKGFLSNGVSFPITINGDEGDDLFIVFHNLAVATLNGNDGDDTFIIQAFALAGSTEDHRALTDLSGDAGADFIQYAVNAPVNINGGDGFDTVIVIGTEFGDDFVVTAHGVYGAGLNVNFINIESLQLDGAEGDDRFFVLGTSPDVMTEITGGLGTDLFSINGPTPANGVISNTLRGHSGILIHEVVSNDLSYNGLKVVGISAHVADNDEAAAIVTETDGESLVVQGDTTGLTLAQAIARHLVDSYAIVLSRPPVNGAEVVISIDPPPGLVFVDGTIPGSVNERRKGDGTADGNPLTFTASTWYIPQTVYFKVDNTVTAIPDLGDIQHKVVAVLGGETKPELTGSAKQGSGTKVSGNGLPVLVSTTTGGDGTHDEVQRVEVQHTSGAFGYFALMFRDAETDPLKFGATEDEVRDALVALPLIGKDASGQPNVKVSKSTVAGHDVYTITFQKDLAKQDVALIKGRELSTVYDPSLPASVFAGGTDGLPEGLRGASITITDSINHPEVVGQTRLILFSDAATHTLVVNKAWNLHGHDDALTNASYEIKLFAGLSIPNVRAQIFANATPAIVAVQTQGSTSVAEASGTTVSTLNDQLSHEQMDEVDVRLSAMPSGTVTVTLGNGNGQLEFFDKDNLAAGPITTLTFTATAGPNSWDTFRHILVRGKDDGITEGFHKADLTLSASGGGYDNVSKLIVADIADNEWPGVRIIESNGSTDVIEYTGGDFSVSEATVSGHTDNTGFPAGTAGLPFKDSYKVVLTKAPTDSVTVTVVADPTRTSRTGGIRSFVEQLEVSTDGGSTWGLTGTLTFTTSGPNAWDKPQTVLVRAKNDTRVDGGDSLVFAPTLDLANNIQGPLFVNGSTGADHTGLTERQAILLPYEIDEKNPMGDVVTATEVGSGSPATITIHPSDISTLEIAAVNDQPNASVHLPDSGLTDPAQLTNVSIQITHGLGKGKIRVVTGGTDNGDGTWTLTLGHEWFSPFPYPGNHEVPDGGSKYVLMQTNPNLLVSEPDQTDILQVHDSDNVNSYDDPFAPAPAPGSVDRNVFAAGRLFFDDANLFGAKATVSTVVNGGPKNGGPAVNDVQKLTLFSTGTFKLWFDANKNHVVDAGEMTGAILSTASGDDVRTALEGLSAIGSGDVGVVKAIEDGKPTYTITFQGALKETDQPKMKVDVSGLTGGTQLNQFRITGLGMGGSGDSFQRTIGSKFDARSEPGGITLQGFEDLSIDLGPGNDHFTIVDTPEGTKTVLNAGAGKDLIDVKAISGHTFVNLGAGSDALGRGGVVAGDTINVHNDGNRLEDLLGLLTVSGDIPSAEVVRLAKGSPAQGGGLVAPVNEIQRLTVDATGGTFRLSLTNPGTQVTATTGDLAFDISALNLRSALQGLAHTAFGVDNSTPDIEVLKAGGVYRITFVSELAGMSIPLLASDETGLRNGLGERDVMNIDDSGNALASVGVLTSSSLTGLSTQQVNEIQTIQLDATQGSWKVAYDGHESGALAFNISAAELQTTLQTLPGTPIKVGDVAVTKNDDTYVIRFQGNLTNTDVSQLAVTNINLMKEVEPSGGNPDAAPSGTTALAGDPVLMAGSVVAATRVQGTATPLINDEQLVTVKATGGTYTLTLLSGTAQEFTTRPLAYNASAEVVRQAIQDAAAPKIAPGDTFEPQKFAVTVDRYALDANGEHATVYVIGFQGKLRQFNGGHGVDLLKVNGSGLTGTATVTTQMDGINYYGIETVNIDTGSNHDIVNIQGTTAGSRGFYMGGGVAVTNVRLHNGNEQVFVSSNADLDSNTIPGFDFLTGTLNDVNGTLNLDFGSGRQKLMISDEASTVGDSLTGDGTAVIITDTVGNVPGGATSRGLPAVQSGAEIWITGLAGLPGTGPNLYPEGGISYKADSASGNFFDGIEYWTGSGNDTITIDGTINRLGSGQRTMTLLNTGLGNDNVTVNLNGALNVSGSDTGPDGFFALNTMGGAFSPIPSTAAVTDNDIVDASLSTLPLVIFGGLGNDNIKGGQNNDIIFGDDGRVQYLGGGNALQAVVGFGGRGDVISSQVLYPTWMLSRDLTLGGQDTIQGLTGEDILVGGAAGDFIDGNAGDDLIFGDAAKISRRPTVITNGRFETLLGTQIYVKTGDESSGTDLVDNTARNYRDPNGTYAPSWAKWQIHNLYHTLDIQNSVAGSLGGNMDGFGRNMLTGGGGVTNSFGGDYIAGGSENDEIFGQLGDDTIQGDGSIASALASSPVFASRTPVASFQLTPSFTVATSVGTLNIRASFDALTDGDDYIEGNGGNDTIFGNLGQDDIVGGSSDLFTLNTAAKRPDGIDFIFGGSGTRIAYDNPAVAAGDVTIPDPLQRHGRDADVIAGDNADIFRLVGLNSPAAGQATTGFLTFAYDQTSTYENRGTLRIIPRAVRLLDYTPGGSDFNAAKAASDIGGADEIHGGSGDDTVYGMVGNDRLFGDGEDDDLIGGYGADWISGGTGNDAILGDDGRIFTSRNGTAEPLYNLSAIPAGQTLDQQISTPGKLQQATINVSGTLKKTVDLTPFNLTPQGLADDPLNIPLNANDIFYGGLGDDAIHGGAGDDAISGAEALPVFFANPTNPGNALRFGDYTQIGQRAGQFRDYDEYNPLVQMSTFLLNFNQSDGPVVSSSTLSPQAHTDGADMLFGDLGNDWMVGGTGKDHMYGGWGNDLLNADDDLTTHGGLNDQPDGPESSYEDIAYGGAGRDVLYANTGGDRLIDWIGEFNSYLVPFAPYGEATISRTLQPQLPEYLYALSASDGGDPTRSGDTGGAASRNGEPDGELGVVLQQDFAWQDQTGAPIDPQAGNIPGGRRDVLRSADFNNGQAQGFAADSGTWTVTNGRYQVAPTVAGGDAVSVFDVESFIPSYFEVQATINAVKPTGGTDANGFLIFDYQGKNNFKFAGINASTNQLQIGHRNAQGWVVDTQAPYLSGVKSDTDYNLFLGVNGSTVTLIVNNQGTLSYSFAPRVDTYGLSHGLHDGMVGIGALNAKAQIDNLTVQRVPLATTLNKTVDFSTGTTSLFQAPLSGTWNLVSGRYEGTAGTTASAIDLTAVHVTSYSMLDLSTVVKTTGEGGVVFDSYAANDFKFVSISAGKITLGHCTPKGWFTDATYSNPSLVTGTDYTIGVTLKGTTVSVTLNGAVVLSKAYNALVTDGDFGLLSRTGATSFDTVTVKTDDPAYQSATFSLLAAQAPVMPVSGTVALAASDVASIVAEAKQRWVASGLLDAAQQVLLNSATVQVTDLAGLELGETNGTTVRLDTTAAGYGWFIDQTPQDNAEFHFVRGLGEWIADAHSPASSRMDLLTTVMHELGHVLGFDDQQAQRDSANLMSETLSTGVRRLPLTVNMIEEQPVLSLRQQPAPGAEALSVKELLGRSLQTFMEAWGSTGTGSVATTKSLTQSVLSPVIDWTEGDSYGSYGEQKKSPVIGVSTQKASWLGKFLIHTGREEAKHHDHGIEVVLAKKK